MRAPWWTLLLCGLLQVQDSKTAEAVGREILHLVERLHAADKITAVSDATKDLHTAISKLEKVRLQPTWWVPTLRLHQLLSEPEHNPSTALSVCPRLQAVDKAFVGDICKSTNVNLEFDLEVLDKVRTN